MKKLSEPFEFIGETVLGKKHTQIRQYFEIEKTDRKIPHWLGFNRPDKTVYLSDIGRKVCHYSDSTGWQCYSFSVYENRLRRMF